jgi:CHAD domain-containing protein
MLNNIKFNLPNGYDLKHLITGLSDHYMIRKGPEHASVIKFYDTFDWRLFNKSLVLYESDNRLCLRKIAQYEILHSVEIQSTPVFIWEFPDSELRRHVTPIIEVRALLKLAELQARTAPYRILNRDEKTVLRFIHEEIRSRRDRSAASKINHLWLQPVKGYSKYAREIAKRFEDAGLTTSREEDIYFNALQAVDKKPGSYSTKVDVKLDPDMRADSATRSILRFLVRIIRINETQIEKDIDTEFVHDFRVAIRRTHSALGQLRYVFPSNITERFKKNLAYVANLSNELRDLDVYLLNEDNYTTRLPPSLRDDINPLFDYLRKKRSKAFKKLIRGLKSKRYTKILNDWEVFLNKPQHVSTAASNASAPIIDLARDRIYKKYQKVIEGGNLMDENTDDRMLHILRIHCKKLRYLMEFFSSLFPPNEINALIMQLKKLQDHLGIINDLRIQEEHLLNITKELPLNQGSSTKTLMAIGSLVGTLGREREAAKDAFAKTFMDFASPANSEVFQELFTSQTNRVFHDNIGHLQQ